MDDIISGGDKNTIQREVMVKSGGGAGKAHAKALRQG